MFKNVIQNCSLDPRSNSARSTARRKRPSIDYLEDRTLCTGSPINFETLTEDTNTLNKTTYFDVLYQVSNFDVTNDIQFYWSTSSNYSGIIGQPAYTIVNAQDYGEVAVPVQDFGSQPPSASYLLAVANVGGITYPTDTISLPLAQSDVAVTSATISADEQNIVASYSVTGKAVTSPSTIDFFWASGPNIADEITTDATPIKISINNNIGTYSAIASIASLGQRPTNATYIIAVADSPYADSVKNSAAVQAPAAIFPASYGWDVTNGGIDFDYQVSDTLPSDVPVDFYWSDSSAFNPTEDQLAASSEIQSGQSSSLSYLGFLHVGADAIADPPAGTTNLFIVIDPNQTVLQSNPSVSTLGYDPEIIITSKYNGDTGQNIFGRFLAVPGAITDETLTFQLSDSLAALRPIVNTQVEDQTVETSSGPAGVLESHPKLNSDGSWDGRSYESDQFDPGTLTGPAILETQALLGDGTDLEDADSTLDVQPLPYWLNSLTNAATPTFTAQTGGQGYYSFKGLVTSLSLPSSSTIPADVPFFGGDQVGASAGLGVSLIVPLDPAIAPTASGYASVSVTYLNENIFNQSYSANFSTSSQSGGATLTVTPTFTLDPETLEPDGGFGLNFAFEDKAQLSPITLASEDMIIEVGGVPVTTHFGITVTPSYDLNVQAAITDTPTGGISLTPNSTFVGLTTTAVLQVQGKSGIFIPPPIASTISAYLGDILETLNNFLPGFFPSSVTLPDASLDVDVTGTLTVNSQVTYTGGSDAEPLTVSIGGEVDATATTSLDFSFPGINDIVIPLLDFVPFPSTFPYKFQVTT